MDAFVHDQASVVGGEAYAAAILDLAARGRVRIQMVAEDVFTLRADAPRPGDSAVDSVVLRTLASVGP
ncbi:MAG TPA: hypothetical protein VD926_11280, partial [Acidimicrobiales bacterium]|nr:hypothetical protein [Acidimicrobiales bacterium]